MFCLFYYDSIEVEFYKYVNTQYTFLISFDVVYFQSAIQNSKITSAR